MLGIVSPVHLGRRRPCGKLAILRAPCVLSQSGRALRVHLMSRLGHGRPDSVPGWPGLLGCSGSGHCGAQLKSRDFHFLFDLI
jgi:hypothetical protein